MLLAGLVLGWVLRGRRGGRAKRELPPRRALPAEAPSQDREPESAEEGAARQRWLLFGAGLLAAFVVVLVLAAAYNRIPVTPGPSDERGFVAADGPSSINVLAGAEAARAPALFRGYGCVSCHVVPGVSGAYGRVGPNLAHLYDHALIAGVLPNTPENLVYWIRFPQNTDPKTGMPNLGVTEKDARDLAAYLQTLP